LDFHVRLVIFINFFVFDMRVAVVGFGELFALMGLGKTGRLLGLKVDGYLAHHAVEITRSGQLIEIYLIPTAVPLTCLIFIDLVQWGASLETIKIDIALMIREQLICLILIQVTSLLPWLMIDHSIGCPTGAHLQLDEGRGTSSHGLRMSQSRHTEVILDRHCKLRMTGELKTHACIPGDIGEGVGVLRPGGFSGQIGLAVGGSVASSLEVDAGVIDPSVAVVDLRHLLAVIGVLVLPHHRLQLYQFQRRSSLSFSQLHLGELVATGVERGLGEGGLGVFFLDLEGYFDILMELLFGRFEVLERYLEVMIFLL
jgi:hypothetical protein